MPKLDSSLAIGRATYERWLGTEPDEIAAAAEALRRFEPGWRARGASKAEVTTQESSALRHVIALVRTPSSNPEVRHACPALSRRPREVQRKACGCAGGIERVKAKVARAKSKVSRQLVKKLRSLSGMFLRHGASGRKNLL